MDDIFIKYHGIKSHKSKTTRGRRINFHWFKDVDNNIYELNCKRIDNSIFEVDHCYYIDFELSLQQHRYEVKKNYREIMMDRVDTIIDYGTINARLTSGKIKYSKNPLP